MSIVSSTFGLAGQTGVTPRRVQLVVTDDYAVLTAAGYLTQNGVNPAYIYPTDIFDVIYNYTAGNISGSYGEFLPSISSNIITLAPSGDGGVTLPVVSGDLPEFSGTTGLLADSGVLVTNVVKKNSTNQLASGADLLLDKGTATESSHAVTINHQSGVITTTSLTTAQFATETITMTNSFVATTSVVLACIMGGTNTTGGVSISATAANGSSVIVLTNNNSSALNGTVIIGFVVF